MIKRTSRGFTLVEIMITIAIIGILIAIAVPGYIRVREASRTRAIQRDLTVIDDATRQYILEYSLGENDAMPEIDELVQKGYLKVEPQPPVAGHYEAAVEFSELGAINPGSYPIFVPDSGNLNPLWVHPELLPRD